MKGRYQTCCL